MLDKGPNEDQKKHRIINHAFDNLSLLRNKMGRRQTRHFNPEYRFCALRKSIFRNQIKPICQRFDFSIESFYLCVSIFDFTTSQLLHSREQLFTVALVCLDLASKLKESQLKFARFDSWKKTEFQSLEHFDSLQKQILVQLDFNVNILTPFDWVCAFLDLHRSYTKKSKTSKSKLKSVVSKVLYKSWQEYRLNKFNVFAVALGVMIVSSNIVKCSERFVKVLKRMFSIPKKQVKACYREVLRAIKDGEKSLAF